MGRMREGERERGQEGGKTARGGGERRGRVIVMQGREKNKGEKRRE